jgi:hypothetical protein
MRLRHDEAGSSVVELGIAMLITAIMSIALVTWMTSAGTAAALHESDDVAVQDLRLAKELISRELRVAEDVLSGDAHLVTVWIDDDDDDFMDSGEQISWYVGSDGALWRWTDTEEGQIQAGSLVYADSGFAFDSNDLAEITKITFNFVAQVAADERTEEPGERQIGVTIHLRNRS